jgi:hypothetical protein
MHRASAPPYWPRYTRRVFFQLLGLGRRHRVFEIGDHIAELAAGLLQMLAQHFERIGALRRHVVVELQEHLFFDGIH